MSFPAGLKNSIVNLMQGKYDFNTLLESADILAEKELEQEITVARVVKELADFYKSSKKLKDEPGTFKYDKPSITGYIREVRKPLKRLRVVLKSVVQFNKENLEVLTKLLVALQKYTREFNPRQKYFLQFQEICTQRIMDTNAILSLVEKAAERIEFLIKKLEKQIESPDLPKLEKILEDERRLLAELIKGEMDEFGLQSKISEEEFLGVQLAEALQPVDNKPPAVLSAKRRKRMRRLKLVLYPLSLYFIAVVGLSNWASYPVRPSGMEFATKKVYHMSIMKSHKDVREDVIINSRDGHKLPAWFYKNTHTDKAVILCHAKAQNKSFLLPYIEKFRHDFNVLVFDFRGHGPGTTMEASSFGYHEQHDLTGALDFLEEKGFKEVGLFGMSMGGATCLITAGNLFQEAHGRKTRLQIKCIVTEGAYADMDTVVKGYGTEIMDIFFGLGSVTKFAMQQKVGYTMKDASPINYVKHIPVPILLLQGDKDGVIPKNSARLLQDNAPNAKWRKFNGTHGVINDSVVKQAIEFMKKNWD